jgi:putative oxidoreductase
MKTTSLVARLLLGLAFTVFGLNGFLMFMPMGDMPPADSPVGHFLAAMGPSGYMKFVSGVQLACGLLLLSGFFVPLALLVLAPVIVNILAFHTFLAPGVGPFVPGLVVSVLWVLAALRYRAEFAPLLAPKPRPAYGAASSGSSAGL